MSVVHREQTRRMLVRGHFFVSTLRASAEWASRENLSRLAAIERADKNIDDSLRLFGGAFARVRPGGTARTGLRRIGGEA
jgi:F-type H+-transporting ATPase subunit gamma